LSLLLAID